MQYNKMTDTDFEYLRSLCGDRVFTGSEITEGYSRDELAAVRSYPEAVVEVLNTEEVSKILVYANEKLIPVVPRGQGTGLVGGAIAINGGIMLSTVRMNKFLELDEKNLTLTLEPGVLLMEIAAYVEKQGLFYPPDPGEKSATIGGNISTNAGGMRAVKYGVTRDYVRELEVVLADGRVMTFGGKTVKNSSGYDLKDLVIGSEGTLAMVTKAVLKLLPKPKKLLSLLVPFPDFSTAIETVPKIIHAKCIPTAIEFMQREVILAAEDFLGKKFPDSSADAYLLLSFDGNSKQELEDIYTRVADICLENNAVDVLIANTEERLESIWSARGAFLEAIKASTSEMDECDVVVPRNCVDEFINFTRDVETSVGVRIMSFGHAGDGNLHVYVLRDELDEKSWQEKLSCAMEKMYDKAHAMKGQVSGEHGIGCAKRAYLHESLGGEQMQIMRSIKQVFDPRGILNPGKVV